MLENCILQCNKKAQPRGSLRFCAILLAKPLEEMKNIMNMGKTRSCKTCFTPMASRYGHETNRCQLRMLKCLFCNVRHPGVVCNTIPIEKKIEEYTRYVQNKTMVFHHNIEEVQPSYLDTPDTRADNGEKNNTSESFNEITFDKNEKDQPNIQGHNTASPKEENPDEEMQSYYQTILLNSLKTYKEEEEEHKNYFSSNLDPVAEVEEET